MVPGGFNRIDFYGQSGVDVKPTTRARELSILELLEDPSETKFLTFNPVSVRQGNWSELVDEHMYEVVKDTGELESIIKSKARSVPEGIEIKREYLISQMAYKLSARWWEVSW